MTIRATELQIRLSIEMAYKNHLMHLYLFHSKSVGIVLVTWSDKVRESERDNATTVKWKIQINVEIHTLAYIIGNN